MGAQIALHLANAGVPSVLLDVSRDAARQGLDRARRLKPDPQFTPDAWSLVTTGSFDEDLARLADVDWVVEAVVERLDVKRELLARVAGACRADAILSTNTSGIPVGDIAEGWPAERKARWLGTHFFNPPRYLSLLELVPTADTAPAVVAAMAAFGDRVLGKGVVVAKDTPNFIGNHLALHGVAAVLRAVESGRYSIDEVDAITGRAIGRPGLGDVPDHRHRRARHPGARAAQPRGSAAGRRAIALVPHPGPARAARRRRRRRREGRARLLRAPEGRRRRPRRSSPSTPRRATTCRSASRTFPTIDAGRSHRRHRRAGADAVHGNRPRRPVPARDAGADTGLCRPRRARHRPLDRRRRPGDALGVRLGPRARSSSSTPSACARWSSAARGAAVTASRRMPPLLAEALAAGRNRVRDGALPPAGPGLDLLALPRPRAGSSPRTRGRAWWTSATACWPWSSTRR